MRGRIVGHRCLLRRVRTASMREAGCAQLKKVCILGKHDAAILSGAFRCRASSAACKRVLGPRLRPRLAYAALPSRLLGYVRPSGSRSATDCFAQLGLGPAPQFGGIGFVGQHGLVYCLAVIVVIHQGRRTHRPRTIHDRRRSRPRSCQITTFCTVMRCPIIRGLPPATPGELSMCCVGTISMVAFRRERRHQYKPSKNLLPKERDHADGSFGTCLYLLVSFRLVVE